MFFIKGLSICTSVYFSLEVGPRVRIVIIGVVLYAYLTDIWTDPEHVGDLKLCPKEASDILVYLFLNLVCEEFFTGHSFDSLCPFICHLKKIIGEELDSEVMLCTPLSIFTITIYICDRNCYGVILSVHYIWIYISERARVIGCGFTGKVWICHNAVEIEREAC